MFNRLPSIPDFMKNILLLILTFALQQHVYAQQITDANISFTFVAKDVNGTLEGFTATSTIDWENPENSVIEGAVLSKTIKTGNFLRDWSLKGSTYFNVDDYPTISFKSTAVKKEGNVLLIDGDLTIKGITKPISIRFTKTGKKLKGTATLFSSDFDITILKKGRISNKVLVRFDLEIA